MGPQVGAQKLGLPWRGLSGGDGNAEHLNASSAHHDAEPTRKVGECDLCGRAT